LNQRPEVKRFVKEQCGTNEDSKPCDIYPDLFIKFIPHEPPVVTFNNDPNTRRDLTNLQNHEIHTLLKQHGLQRVGGAGAIKRRLRAAPTFPPVAVMRAHGDL